MNKNLKRVCVTAIMLALSTVLSLIKVWQMPLGGSVTLLSMLPVCMVAIMYGTKWAIAPCILYGFFQSILGGVFGWGLTPWVLVGCMVFDYLLAYGVLCFAGILRKKGTAGLVMGTALGCILRFVCHFISGVILWTNFEQFSFFGNVLENHPIVYSLCYNGFYMLPETVFTVIAAVLIFKLKPIKRLFEGNI